MDRLGPFMLQGHKLWDWTVSLSAGLLLRQGVDGVTLFRRVQSHGSGERGSRWVEEVGASPRPSLLGLPCTVRHLSRGGVRIASEVDDGGFMERHEDLVEVLCSWGHMWMWRGLTFLGGTKWLFPAIEAGTCVAVMDGSYMREIYPNLGAAAFVLEYTAGSGRIIGAFPETSLEASAFHSELLGLLEIHLLLLAANRVRLHLGGRVHIFSDCLGALGQVIDLPKDRIPARCKHGDALKSLMLQCQELFFGCTYSHVSAHQDNLVMMAYLSCPTQLNWYMDGLVKTTIWSQDLDDLPRQDSFPLEPVAVYIGGHKIAPGRGEALRFWVHKILAEEVFYEQGVMGSDQFHAIPWREVYDALHEVPEMFQKWACKQVLDIVAINCNMFYYTEGHDPRCLSCEFDAETTGHVLCCREVGIVEALDRSIDLLECWLSLSDTEPLLKRVLVEFARGRGRRRMSGMVERMGEEWKEIGRTQDLIGWRRYLEGMVSHRIIPVQRNYLEVIGSKWLISAWMKGLIMKLLDVAHGQWLYRNMQVHDQVSGVLATKKKEELQTAIEEVLGGREEDLEEDDKWLLEVRLGDLDGTSGEEQEY